MTNGAQPAFARALSGLFERSLNHEIGASTAAADLLAELDGQSFAIDVRGTGVRCVLRATGERVAVEAEPSDDDEADWIDEQERIAREDGAS